MVKAHGIAIITGAVIFFCPKAWAQNYDIGPFPANSVLGPRGPVAIPAAMLNMAQASGNPLSDVYVNNLGQFVFENYGNNLAGGPVDAYLPTAAYGLSAGIQQISGSAGYNEAYGINDSGQIAGLLGDVDLIWNIGGSPTSLPDITVNNVPVLTRITTAINNAGQVTIQFNQAPEDGAQGCYAGVWSPSAENGLPAGLTLLTPDGSYYANDYLNAVGINNTGDVVYNGTPSGSSGATQAYLRVDLAHGDLSAGTLALQGQTYDMYMATGVTDSDEVVGMASFPTEANDPSDPALWTSTTGAIDLNTLLPANSGWVLQTVTGIDQLGDIEGMGLYNGVSTPYLLSVPEPMLGILVWLALAPACSRIRSS